MTTTLNIYDAFNSYLSSNIGSIRGAVAAQVAYLGVASAHLPGLGGSRRFSGDPGDCRSSKAKEEEIAPPEWAEGNNEVPGSATVQPPVSTGKTGQCSLPDQSADT